MRYSKQHLIYQEQLDRFESRGLEAQDKDLALVHLSDIGYYRLTGYSHAWRILEKGAHGTTHRREEFLPGHTFEELIEIYTFDHRLRLILLDALGRVEIALRAQVAYVHGKRDPFAYLDRNHLGSMSDKMSANASGNNFEVFIENSSRFMTRSREDFAQHIRQKYDGVPPIWIATELWDFGQLTTFYSMMQPNDQTEIASHFNVPVKKMLVSWLQSLNHLRNICAHHGRLYRRILVVKPGKRDMTRIPNLKHIHALEEDQASRAYAVIAILVHLVRNTIPGSEWSSVLKDLLTSFPQMSDASLMNYGFPEDWQNLPLWSFD